ncbi:MAG: glycosyltransferase family 4 protein [Candidatus Binatia bacterium]
MLPAPRSPLRLAFIVSHPIQYYAPLYRRLAQRDDIAIKVFFTWHAGQAAVHDHGFKTPVAWDIPLTQGYEFEHVANLSSDPGTHRFFGLRNPSLVQRVMAWRPDAVHLTGWAWLSHLMALRGLVKRGVPVLFRGDSHLLGAHRRGPKWSVKRRLLRYVYSWPAAFLVTGAANRAYYEAFGVGPERLHRCPHSIDVRRFAEPAAAMEREALRWRQQLGIADGRCVLLFAGKFERKKRPVELMRAVQSSHDRHLLLVMVGDGELAGDVYAIAGTDPDRFRVLPFQNQSRMPVVYRLGDVFVLPSAYGETWGLGVNEALACGRPVLVSDRVGCAADLVSPTCGRIFPWADFPAMLRMFDEMTADREMLAETGHAAGRSAWAFDIASTEAAIMESVSYACGK